MMMKTFGLRQNGVRQRGILLDMMSEAKDDQLRDQQAGFSRSRSCTEHIATFGIILEQSLENLVPRGGKMRDPGDKVVVGIELIYLHQLY